MARLRWQWCWAAAVAAALLCAPAVEALQVKRFEQSVVRVFVVVTRSDGAKMSGSGTGFVIAPEYVATNNHIVALGTTAAGETPTRVVTVREPGTVADRTAEIVWTSRELDLAVIRVPGMTRPALKLSHASPLKYPPKGAEVWALGFPGVADVIMPAEAERASATVTRGVVGRIGMGGSNAARTARPVIQHDASINRGSSGGPLLDDCGIVVGINTFLPMTVFDIGLDATGSFKAYGTPNTGVFASPHITSLVEAARNAPELRAVKIETTGRFCGADETPLGLYIAVGAALFLAGAALVLVLHGGALRRLRHNIEVYAAWRRRRRAGSGRGGHTAEHGTGAMRAADTCALHGHDAEGTPIRLALEPDRLTAASPGRERGLVIGRSKRLADVVVPKSGISRRHVRLVAMPDGSLAIEDLDSARGTKLNDKPLPPYERVPIKAGDKIALDGVVLTLERARERE